ncbi:MAG: sulfur carrier protein ThiS [Rikenellaceae bacterium]
MKLLLNNQEVESSAKTLAELLSERDIETKGIAVALNRRVIARTAWAEQPISEGDSVVMVSAVYGG